MRGDDYRQFEKEMKQRGIAGGKEICEVARTLHPDAVLIMPMYRSCAVIPKQDITGNIEMILYHDPQWMGDERTAETLPHYSERMTLHGDRSFVNVSKDGRYLTYDYGVE